jgi:hypothetical protein
MLLDESDVGGEGETVIGLTTTCETCWVGTTLQARVTVKVLPTQLAVHEQPPVESQPVCDGKVGVGRLAASAAATAVQTSTLIEVDVDKIGDILAMVIGVPKKLQLAKVGGVGSALL